MLERLKERVCEQNLALVRYGLVVLTWGNVSALSEDGKYVVIKPSGVSYDKMTPGDMVVTDRSGNVVEGALRPSTDLATHLALYDAFPVKRSPVEWAFRWLCNHPQVATVLSGLTSVEQVKDNLRIFDTVEPDCMSKEELELIDKVRDAYNSRIKVGCTGCAYCMPCPMGIEIPNAARMSLLMTRSPYKPYITAEWQAKMHKIEDCVNCRRCVAHCPYSLDTPRLLRDQLKWYEAFCEQHKSELG